MTEAMDLCAQSTWLHSLCYATVHAKLAETVGTTKTAISSLETAVYNAIEQKKCMH